MIQNSKDELSGTNRLTPLFCPMQKLSGELNYKLTDLLIICYYQQQKKNYTACIHVNLAGNIHIYVWHILIYEIGIASQPIVNIISLLRSKDLLWYIRAESTLSERFCSAYVVKGVWSLFTDLIPGFILLLIVCHPNIGPWKGVHLSFSRSDAPTHCWLAYCSWGDLVPV